MFLSGGFNIMKITYDNIVEFMKDYFETFSTCAQNPKTARQMEDYLTPDLEFVPYIAGNARISGRDEFLRLMSAHPSSIERLTPEDIMVDEKRRIAVVLIKTEIIDSATGKILVTKRYHVVYKLILDRNKTLKIRKILFFEEILPPGTLDVGDVLRKDAGMANLFSDTH
jgi:hypothetical protein